MLIPTIIMGALAAGLFLIGYFKGQGQHISGIKSALSMAIEILPLLVLAFIMAGMIRVLLPAESISKWIGSESGIRGILVGTIAGVFMSGGPYVCFPIAAGLLQAGSGVGTVVAFLTAWSMGSITRLPIEFGIMGWRFTLIRIASSFFFPPIAGLIARTIWRIAAVR